MNNFHQMHSGNVSSGKHWPIYTGPRNVSISEQRAELEHHLRRAKELDEEINRIDATRKSMGSSFNNF